MQDWFPTRAVTGSHRRTHRPRNAVSKTALQFVLPASDKTQSLSSPSFGKARLPEKAALWVKTGPAAPHGTWERTSRRLSRKPDRETEKIKSLRPPGCEGLLATGSVRSVAQDWAALQLREAEVWPALAKQPSSKPCWQVFQILVKDKGSQAAPTREALGGKKHRSVIKLHPQNPQSRFNLRVPVTQSRKRLF